MHLEQILTEYIPLLSEVGLKINVTKSGIVIKTLHEPAPPAHLVIATLEFPVVPVAKILGVSITSSKALLPALKKLQVPIEVLMRLYHTLICPSLIYGHKAGAITNANRLSLMNRELQILRDLISIAHPPPPDTTVFQLLDKKTINRKDSVYRIRYYGHVRRQHSTSLLQKARTYQIASKRRLGRPRFTFNDTLLHDFQKYPAITQAVWDRLIYRAVELKKVTATLYAREDSLDDPMSAELMIYLPEENPEDQ